MTDEARQYREQLKELSAEDFLKQNTRDELNAIASEFGVESPESLGNKQEVFDAIVKAADLPNPALRGESTVDDPVAQVWQIADRMWTEAGDSPPRRVDCVEAAKDAGIAHYTARTQYQAWFTHTNKGQNLISAGNTEGLPRSVAQAFGVEQEEEVAAEA